MGELAERAMVDSVSALSKQNESLAEEVIQRDIELDRLQREIEEKVVIIIARRQPVAVDLREVVGALRISGDLERVGDLAMNIAKRVKELTPSADALGGVQRINDLVLARLKQVLSSFATRNLSDAVAVWRGDREVDALCTSQFRELLTYIAEHPTKIGQYIHLMFITKNIERIGDHATNIAETVYYIVEGTSLEPERPKGDTTTLSSVAEG
jgi:phosphate transport system protein